MRERTSPGRPGSGTEGPSPVGGAHPATTSPVILFILGALTQYGGASLAVGLFALSSPVAIAWLRLLGAGGVLWAWRRPTPWRWARRDLVRALAFGLVMVAMNTFFYLAIDRLPLGTAVAIEFIGPVTVGVLASPSRRNLLSLVLAASGVVLLAGLEWDAEPLGLVFIGLAAVCWAGYILLGQRVALGGSGEGKASAVGGLDGLTVGMIAAAVATLPLVAPALGSALEHPRRVLLPALAVGVLSNAVPYGIDQVVLRSVSRTTFAILLAILPAAATVVGAVALAQVPTPAEILGIVLVMTAVATRDRGSRPPTPRTPCPPSPGRPPTAGSP